jgi:hypothetical protein
MYDTLKFEELEAQVKCFECEGKTYVPGDKVGPLHGHDFYSIALREGGYAIVANGVLNCWSKAPLYSPVFDKWGGLFSERTVGIVGESYRFQEE